MKTETTMARLLTQAASILALMLAGAPAAHAQLNIPGITPPAACPPNTSCVPGTPPIFPPVTPPGTCGPGNGGAPCGAAGPAMSGTKTGINVGAGNPINIITGNKYQREVDMAALPGVLGLELVRHYNSAFSGAGASSNLIGRGWKLSYETDLYIEARTLQIVQADGTRLIFNRDPANPDLCAGTNAGDGRIRVTRGARAESYVWELGDGRALSFNEKGKLVQILAPDGQFVSLQHDARGWLTRVTDPQGRSLQLSYLDRAGSGTTQAFRGVQRISTPVGQFEFSYGSVAPGADSAARAGLSNLVQVRAPDGVRHYHYEDTRFPTLLTGISELGRDGAGAPAWERVATYGYDSNGRANLTVRGYPARLVAGSDGKPLQPARLVPGTGLEQVTLSSAEPGVTTVTNSLGQRTAYRYGIIAGQFRLIDVRGPGCATCGETNVRYGYDTDGRLTGTIRLDAAGVPYAATKTTFDALGRMTRVDAIDYRDGKPLPVRPLVRYVYTGEQTQPSMLVRPSVAAGREHSLSFDYNARGDVIAVTERGWSPEPGGQLVAIERSTRYAYAMVNGRSVLRAIDGPMPNGPLASPADSDITLAEWDSKGNAIVALTMPGKQVSRFEYDATGRLSTVRSDADGVTRFSYNARSQLTATTSGGVSRTAAFDGQGNVIETGYRDAAGAVADRYGYDAAGRAIWAASRLGILTRNRFDTEGQLLETRQHSAMMEQVRSYAYDGQGRLSAVTDPAGGTRRFSWNARALPVASSDALGRVKHYQYDSAGNMEQIDMPAGALQEQRPASARFAHDAAGNLTMVTGTNGAVTRYWVDDFGRQVAQDSADSGQSTRRYDASDRLVASTDALGNRAEYGYDHLGRIVRQAVYPAQAGAAASVTTWAYAGRHLVAIDHPEQSERFAFDGAGRLAQKTVSLTLADGTRRDYVTAFEHDAGGQLVATSLPDGSRLIYVRNGQKQIVAVERGLVATPWLRWVLAPRALVSELKRDLVGLRDVTFGNGVRTSYERSAEGVLARIYTRAREAPAARPAASAAASLPGALGLPLQAQAALDQRYLWDVQGNLLHTSGLRGSDNYLYDRRDRLIAQASVDAAGAHPGFARYAVDAAGNRVLAQEASGSQDQLQAGTVREHYAPASNRWRGSGDALPARYDGAGQPRTIGARNVVWDAYGRLTRVEEGGRVLATYRYNYRGERVAKEAGALATHYLYQDRKLVAELDRTGRITRQYLYLADEPVAIIDHAGGAAPVAAAGAWARVGADLAAIWRAWFGHDTLAYLHNNHLGATEAITGANGEILWRARYTPFGKLRDVHSGAGFAFALRLPGQFADDETGLYYNDHRYYDPQRGRYLSPDPLGLKGSVNSYAYAGGNPLKFIDPSGLVLFAFDGTGNDETDPARLSNVVRMRDLYESGKTFYITGPATRDPGTGIVYDGLETADTMFSYTGKARIDAMIKYLQNYAGEVDDQLAIDIDITGFSRGAAQARDFANQIVNNTSNGYYKYKDKDGKAMCQKVNFRFMGLFDTVLSNHRGDYQLGIPDAFKYVAHASALNEYRGNTVSFPSESILGKPAPAGMTRIERGFLGSHSDIGGGFPQQDLAKIAMVWMVDQAKLAGVNMREPIRTIIANPVLHDKSANLMSENGGPSPGTEDRMVNYTDGTHVRQRLATKGVMTYNDTVQFIQYKSDPNSFDNISGTVDVAKYLAWLNDPANHFGKIDMTVQ